MEHWGDDEKRKPKFLDVNPSKGHFIHHKSHEILRNITQKQHLLIQRNENRVLCNKIIYNR